MYNIEEGEKPTMSQLGEASHKMAQQMQASVPQRQFTFEQAERFAHEEGDDPAVTPSGN